MEETQDGMIKAPHNGMWNLVRKELKVSELHEWMA